MSEVHKWDGYGSYEDYINRGLGDLFNTSIVSDDPHTKQAKAKPAVKRSQARRKPKDVYDIVGSYPHHGGDNQWLVDLLLGLPLAKREPAMLRYRQVYNSAQSAVAESDRPTGHGRRAANTWLREFINQ
jgi:hypothetical protein